MIKHKAGINRVISKSLKYIGVYAFVFLLSLSGCGPQAQSLQQPPALTQLNEHNFFTQSKDATPLFQDTSRRSFQSPLRQTTLRGINYYPQNTPWEKFWPEYDAAVVQTDLQRMHDMGFNTVRIFVYYTAFGGPEINPLMKSRLVNFLQQAKAQQLQVVITLFDQYQDYPHLDDARQHLAQLTEGLASDPTIAAWDLKNESDRDYIYHGEATVKNWLVDMQQFLHGRVQQPITASYANASSMGEEVSRLDYLTFHYYADERTFRQTVQSLRQRFPDQPLVLGEFGYHTWQNNPKDPHPEAHQYNYFQAILAAAQEQGLKGMMAWSLYDYPVIAGSTFLSEMSHEQHMGLWRLTNTAKPACLALQQSVFLVDADTGTAVTPLTREIKAVFELREAESVHLRLKNMATGLTTTVATLLAKQGVNTLQWKVSGDTLASLLALSYRLQLDSQKLVPLFPSEQTQTQLTLRLD